MKPDQLYWDKPDLADDLRAMADNMFSGGSQILQHALLYSAARRIEWLESKTEKS